MSEQALDKRRIVSELARSAHRDLAAFEPIGMRAAREDPEFFAHLVAWNHVKGEVRDAKVALPVIALIQAGGTDAADLAENALAHMADLRPREFARAVDFARDVKAPTRIVRRLVERYLLDLEKDRHEWNRTAVQHRRTLQRLYALYRVPPGGARTKDAISYEKTALFGEATVNGERIPLDPPEGSPFAAIKQLPTMSPAEAAGTILAKVPFLIARGALHAKATDPDIVLALIERMSAAELVTEMRWLKRAGVETIPALRGALEKKLGEAAAPRPGAKRAPLLKAGRKAEQLEADGESALSGKLRALQEKQIDAFGGVDGDWLILGDKSGSMSIAIDVARQVAGALARMVKGKVHLVFFDTLPTAFDATGKTYEEIVAITKRVTANGGTSIGCGLQWALEKGIEVDGIAVVSDGGENTVPHFAGVYAKYAKRFDREPTVYLYECPGDKGQVYQWPRHPQASGADVQVFDLQHSAVDFYSLPNLVQTMRTARYGLVDEIAATPLRRLDEVLRRTAGVHVLPQRQAVHA